MLVALLKSLRFIGLVFALPGGGLMLACEWALGQLRYRRSKK